MHKKIPAFLIAFLLVLQYAVSPASAAGDTDASISVISARNINNYMHCYFQPNDPDLDITSISIGAVAADFKGSEMQNPKLIAGSDRAVRYVLLIDTSTSMPANSQKLLTFANALLEAEEQQAYVTIASFGDSFEVIEEDLSDPEEAGKAIERLTYEQEVSDISGGVVEAITYLTSGAKTGGEICNLIVLTDGEAYLSGTGSSSAEIGQAASKAKELIEDTPEIVVHTVGFGQWESRTYAAVSSGAGMDVSIRSDSGASEAGGQIAEFVDGLYYVNIPFTPNQGVEFFDAQLMLVLDSPDDLEFIPLNHLRNLNYIRSTDISDQPDGDAEGDEPDGAEATPEWEEDVPENADSATEGDAQEENDEASAAGVDNPDETSPADIGDGKDAEESSGVPWIPIVAGAVALAAAALLIGIVLGRKKKQVPVVRQEDDIWIRVELLSNNTIAGRLEYPLGGGLVIGSDSSCDIVFSDDTVLARNSKIYLRDGFIYIEDLNPDSNTSIGGMKLHMPNRLRDGDEVTIGAVRFRVRILLNAQ